MLDRLLKALSGRTSRSSRLRRVEPEVHVELTDLELERRAEAAVGGFTDSSLFSPEGIEFRYEAFNPSGELVCSGKVDHIPGVQVTVCHIDTVRSHQRKGYATAVVRWLRTHFSDLTMPHVAEGLPIVPMDERGESGAAFWTALRKRPVTGMFVKESIGFHDACLLVRQAESAASKATSRSAAPMAGS
jgi:hypothetical protein